MDLAGRDSYFFFPGCGGFGLLGGLAFFNFGFALDLAAGGRCFLTGGAALDLPADGCCGFFQPGTLEGEVRTGCAGEAPSRPVATNLDVASLREGCTSSPWTGAGVVGGWTGAGVDGAAGKVNCGTGGRVEAPLGGRASKRLPPATPVP